jgi:glycosyltransferase involved in cell wall biosynthesis
MRIGLFTDTYRPSINGIVFVVESLKRELEAQGHVVYVFCPARSIRPSKHAEILDEDEHIIRFPSIKGAFYDDYDTTIFFPPRVLNRIRDLDLDIIHFLTPGQVGLMGVNAGIRCDVPLVAQHCTDLREYVEHYRDGLLLPGILALVGLLPLAVKVNGKDIREIMKMYRPRRGSVQWNIDIVESMVTLIYSKCDAVIALSRKSQKQLQSWQKDENYRYDVTLMPNGVDPLPKPTAAKMNAFKELWNIAPTDEVFGFVGRLGSEKNLEILIAAIELLVSRRPNARLLFIGDFEYRETLEEIAASSNCPDRIVFTGALPREELGAVYATMDVFVFPSLTDTQGWAVHEAALSGLPLLLVDHELSEVLEDGKNGYLVQNKPEDIADKLEELFSDDEKRAAFGAYSKTLAKKFTEKKQVAKLAKLYEQSIIKHHSKDY